MLFGAMDELATGDPWVFSSDIGPVISEVAKRDILDYVAEAKAAGRLLKRIATPEEGHFVPASVISVDGIKDLAREVFGPILHIATFKADAVAGVIEEINASGYGLTFGLHTRIDDRVEEVTKGLKAGNIYVNRNQIGAIVGSQPFGGEGLSGTGPKAGGPHYVARFLQSDPLEAMYNPDAESADIVALESALATSRATDTPLSTLDLPGPTGESNRLSLYGRGVVLCLGPGADLARKQAEVARKNGCAVVLVADGLSDGEGVAGVLDPAVLQGLVGIDVVAYYGSRAIKSQIRQALAGRDGPIVPLAGGDDLASYCLLERHVCIDTTAAGGNASLLAAAAEV